jgi:hypothetical protein
MAEQNQSSDRASPARWRFSIRSLLLLTTAVAALFPAAWFAWFLLLNASTPWASFAYWLTASILAGAVLIAINRTRGTRSYWAGFAVAGFVFFLIVPSQLLGEPFSSWIHDRDHLLTPRLSRAAYARYVMPIIQTAPVTSFVPAGGAAPGGFASGAQPPAMGIAGGPAYSFVVGPSQPDSADFVKVADLLWTLLFAFVGGWISLAIWATGPKARTQGTSDDQPVQ